jgi:hypothetical protein
MSFWTLPISSIAWTSLCSVQHVSYHIVCAHLHWLEACRFRPHRGPRAWLARVSAVFTCHNQQRSGVSGALPFLQMFSREVECGSLKVGLAAVHLAGTPSPVDSSVAFTRASGFMVRLLHIVITIQFQPKELHFVSAPPLQTPISFLWHVGTLPGRSVQTSALRNQFSAQVRAEARLLTLPGLNCARFATQCSIQLASPFSKMLHTR